MSNADSWRIEDIKKSLRRAGSPEIHFFPVTTSTNDEAIRRARSGGAHGEIFIADQQTAGRGRMDRSWESPQGKNLYLSFLLRPEIHPATATFITLVAGTAVFDALHSFLNSSVRSQLFIKWPNDLFLQDRKIAGILSEMESEGGKTLWIVTGIGVNLNVDENDFTPEVRQIATSVKIATGRAVDRTDFCRRLIKAFESRFQEFREKGPRDCIDFCNQHSYLNGRRVVAEGPSEKVHGIVQGLDPHGYLLIRTGDGEVMPIVSGDVMIEGEL